MVAGEEEVVVGDVKAVFVDDSDRVRAVDLRVDDGSQMCCGVVVGPEAEELEAGAGLGVVDYVESFAFGVVFDAEWVEVCLAGWEVEELEGFGDGACGCVVVEIELALMLWISVDALERSQLIVRGVSTLTPSLLKIAVGLARSARIREVTG
jgi:hypothetical protein